MSGLYERDERYDDDSYERYDDDSYEKYDDDSYENSYSLSINDRLVGDDNDDYLDGGDGDDFFIGGQGFNTLLGGNGIDTAQYVGLRNEFDIKINPDGTYTVIHGEQEDKLEGVEKLHFDDGSMSIDHAVELRTHQEEVTRLYNALFERDPDSVGLTNWVNHLVSTVNTNSKSNIQKVAQEFTNSDEFQSKYGPNISHGEYVNLLYQNILHREADQDGYNHWLNGLENNDIDRGTMLTGFSESTEYINQTALSVDNFLQTTSLDGYILI